MSGLFELLIIVFFIVAAAFDAIQRNRKKEERKRQMEEQESKERPDEGAGRSPDEAPRETAETMVPEDLWAILTGQAPTGERPAGEQPADERGDNPPEQPQIPAPVPSDRMGSETPEGRSRAGQPVERRSRQGQSVERRSREGQEVVDHTPPSRDAESSRRSAGWMETVDELDDRDRRYAADPVGSMEEPWDRFEDISEGEILEGGGRVQGSVELDRPTYGARARRTRRGSGRGQYTGLLESGRLEDLRKAIVLREVLGRPVGFREPGEDLF